MGRCAGTRPGAGRGTGSSLSLPPVAGCLGCGVGGHDHTAVQAVAEESLVMTAVPWAYLGSVHGGPGGRLQRLSDCGTMDSPACCSTFAGKRRALAVAEVYRARS